MRMPVPTRNTVTRRVQTRFAPQARFWGKVRNDRAAKTSPRYCQDIAKRHHRPDGPNPIAREKKPKNAAQAWLPSAAYQSGILSLRCERPQQSKTMIFLNNEA